MYDTHIPPALEATPGPGIEQVTQGGTDLKQLALLAWRSKWWGLATLALVVALALLMLARATPIYSATMVVMPPEPQKGFDTSRGLGASLLGGLQASPGDDKFTRYQEGMSSVVIAERLQKRHQLLQRLMPGRWDAANKRWLPPDGLMNNIRGGISSLFGLPPYAEPSSVILAEYIASQVTLVSRPRSTIVRVVYNNPDPAFAVEFLTLLHAEVNAYLRDEATAAATIRIRQLEQRLEQTTQGVHRNALLSLLEQEQRDLLLLDPALPYAATVIDPPYASSLPVSPRPLLTIFVALILGTVAGLVVALLVSGLRREA
ncbi:Wzz/FepE/Etk N-terminal domain-containing protein [Niveispirillum irakense]|uniref:Wzz/FepE/Etk N-terminal domain-containing protein n=1 Tax=Niveispirillum irakense TaxID=34011 RepID=UPI000423C433|nr:Wzz/FepE/Etk N-terminal domain-containing protein [Niveispirillum irakense]